MRFYKPQVSSFLSKIGDSVVRPSVIHSSQNPSSSGAPLRDDIHAAPLHPLPAGNSSLPHRMSLLKKICSDYASTLSGVPNQALYSAKNYRSSTTPGFRFTSPGATNILPRLGRYFVPSAFCFCWLKSSFQASVLNSKFVIRHSSSGAPLRDDNPAAPLQILVSSNRLLS